MERGPLLWLIALGLALYGAWTALYVPAMLVGESSPLLLLGLLAQAVFALAAAAGIARGFAWAAGAVLLFAAAVVFTQLVEGFVLQIAPYLRSVGIAVATVVGALAVCALVGRGGAVRAV
ncbi:MAG: hypothetical protein SF182_13200 [Deltaproteobacteria bacterium]|nr:hypothetical protein [Deltaproteobacteria bacterium]